jgi:NADH:ubiquinone oxidoreductase subunit
VAHANRNTSCVVHRQPHNELNRHAWMHKMTDDIPTDPQHDWQPSTAEYKPNQTGTKVSVTSPHAYLCVMDRYID